MHHVSLLSVRFVGRANGPGIRVIRVRKTWALQAAVMDCQPNSVKVSLVGRRKTSALASGRG